MDSKDDRLERKDFISATKDIMQGYELVYKPKLSLFHLRPKRMSDKGIGQGGIVFRDNKGFPVNTILKIILVLPPDNIPIKPLGRVIWTEKIARSKLYNVGVSFINLTGDQQHHIANYIAAQSKKIGSPAYEKRKYPRVNISLPIKYALYLPSPMQEDSEEGDSITKDVGGGGICLTVNHLLPVGVFLELGISFPFSTSLIDVFGKVVWVKEKDGKYDTGIEFINMNEETQNQIMAFTKKEFDNKDNKKA